MGFVTRQPIFLSKPCSPMAAMRSSMAVAVIGGLVTSTLMSLVLIPCVYYLFEQMKRKVTKGEDRVPVQDTKESKKGLPFDR